MEHYIWSYTHFHCHIQTCIYDGSENHIPSQHADASLREVTHPIHEIIDGELMGTIENAQALGVVIIQ